MASAMLLGLLAGAGGSHAGTLKFNKTPGTLSDNHTLSENLGTYLYGMMSNDDLFKMMRVSKASRSVVLKFMQTPDFRKRLLEEKYLWLSDKGAVWDITKTGPDKVTPLVAGRYMPLPDAQEGDVLDVTTQLVWRRFPESMTFEGAVALCEEEEQIDQKEWKLPTIEQLLGIIDERSSIKSSLFPSVKSYMPGLVNVRSAHWSSSQSTSSSQQRQVLDFFRGEPMDRSLHHSAYVYCVRPATVGE